MLLRPPQGSVATTQFCSSSCRQHACLLRALLLLGVLPLRPLVAGDRGGRAKKRRCLGLYIFFWEHNSASVCIVVIARLRDCGGNLTGLKNQPDVLQNGFRASRVVAALFGAPDAVWTVLNEQTCICVTAVVVCCPLPNVSTEKNGFLSNENKMPPQTPPQHRCMRTWRCPNPQNMPRSIAIPLLGPCHKRAEIGAGGGSGVS